VAGRLVLLGSEGYRMITLSDIKLSLLRTRILSLEQYGYHVFLWRWWKRGEAAVRHW
jgi:hypothetical protein